METPKCPICNGEMWDNKPKKATGEFKSSAPNYKCKKKTCEGVIWPEMGSGSENSKSPQEFQQSLSEPVREPVKEVNWDEKGRRIERQHSQSAAIAFLQLLITTGQLTEV